MKKFIMIFINYVIILCLAGIFGTSVPLWSKTRVVTSYGYIADIVREIGREEVWVEALAGGTGDPHFVTPRPSFIAKLRKADLLIINGGQLEIGWLPPVIQQANNPVIQPGGKGLLVLMDVIEPIDVSLSFSRAQGDVHPEGNPHIQLDPHHIPVFARAVAEKLSSIDRTHRELYQKNLESFLARWQKKLVEWEKVLTKLKGIKVVEYHRLYDYLFRRYGVEVVGTLEPLPGIPPTPKHIGDIIQLISQQKVSIIIQDVYHNKKTARFVSGKAGIKMVILPHDIGSVQEVTGIFSLFDEITRRLGEL